MKAAFLLFLLSFLPVGASTRHEVLGGRFRFDAPGDWLEARSRDNDSVSFVALEVPHAGGDTDQVANVMIDVALSHRHWDLKRYGDAKLNQLQGGRKTRR